MFRVIVFLLIIIMLAVLALQVKKETFIDASPSSSDHHTCYEWINNTISQRNLKDYLDNLDMSNEENTNLKFMLDNMKPNKNVIVTNQGTITQSGSPCILTKDTKKIHNTDHVSCRDMGFSQQNGNEDCIHYIENVGDFDTLKIAASNFYYIKNREQIERKKQLEIEKEIAESQLQVATEENIVKTGEHAIAVQNHAHETSVNTDLNNRKTELTQRLNEVSDTAAVQNTISRTEQHIQTLSDVARVLGSTEGVTFYTQPYYRGSSVTKNIGRYDMNDMGIPNDSIRSIRVPTGFSVKIFEHGFTGSSLTLNASINDLSNHNMNDYTSRNWANQISSFIVERR